MYLVLELCSGGDLYARDPYDENQAKGIVASILDAVAYLHSKKITHRDLKYENIMFASPTSPTVKIIDFGLSKKYSSSAELMHETVGTGEYNKYMVLLVIVTFAFADLQILAFPFLQCTPWPQR